MEEDQESPLWPCDSPSQPAFEASEFCDVIMPSNNTRDFFDYSFMYWASHFDGCSSTTSETLLVSAIALYREFG